MLQALTGQAGAQRGSSAAHKDTSDLAKWYVAQLFCACLNDHENGLIRDMVVRNFMGRTPPKASMSGVDDMELAESLVIDKGLAELGWVHSEKELGERYGRSKPKTKEDALAPPTAAPQDQPSDTGGPQLPEPEMPEFDDSAAWEEPTSWGYEPGLMDPQRNGKVPA